MAHLGVDDEGTPTQRNVLIEDGILKGYMQDKLNARLNGCCPNRQMDAANLSLILPMPRMTKYLYVRGKSFSRRNLLPQ